MPVRARPAVLLFPGGELTEYISETVPSGTTVNSMFHQNSLLLPLMLPEYNVVGMRHPATIQKEEVEYITLSSKNLWGAYDLITPEYYDWVATNGELVFSTYGNTFWDVTIYRLSFDKRKQMIDSKYEVSQRKRK